MRIIPGTEPAQQPPRWQRLLSEAISDPQQLLQTLGLPQSLLPAARAADRQFSLRVPRGFVGRMRPGDASDPLLRQVLPLGEELHERPGYSRDPLQELAAMPAPGVLHKYAHRVLLTATGACAVHCRYCFRRHYPYGQANPGRDLAQTLDYLRQNPAVREVILSGGDPLTLSDQRLSHWVEQLQAIPHIQRLRLHTRLPVVLPERIDTPLLAWLGCARLQTVVVIHCNHPNEIDAQVGQALRRLGQAGVTMLNQSVLLRGVNDDAATLSALSERLFAWGVLPYYLHLLDPVSGAAHFEVSEQKAKSLVHQVREELPGYLVPALVREIPGQASKTPV